MKQFVITEKLSNNFKNNDLGNITSLTFKILDSCFDPRVLDRYWDRRGLVYGHVQSGKTGNRRTEGEAG